MAYPHVGQTVASSQGWARGPKQPRSDGQTATAQLNATRGPENRLRGGGGMAVGSLRTAKGVPRHPKAARAALLSGMKG